MNALSLYHDLKERGVYLEAQGEHLRVNAPVDVVTEEDRTALVKFKPVLLKFLSQAPAEEPLRESKARWSGPGRIRIRDPFAEEWHEWSAAKCLPGVVAEADGRRTGDAP